MALLSLQAFKNKWAALTGRFKDNNTFDIAEKDYREFSGDIADSLFDPVEKLMARVEKLEQPAPPAPEGIKWVKFPKVSVVGDDVVVTLSEADFRGTPVEYAAGTAKANVSLPPAGWGDRIDILAATATGWAYIHGEDPGVTPAMVIEGQPDAVLLFAAYLFWGNGGGVVEEAIVFVKVVELNGQDYAPDANGRLVLPALSSGPSEAAISPLDFTVQLPFDKDYLVNWQVAGPTPFAKNALDFKPGKIIRGNIKANGVNRPTFSNDFIINQYEWVNTNGKQHRFYAEAQADGKILIDIVDA